LYSKEFQNILDKVENPYGKGGASKEIVNIIKGVNLHNIIKKPFHDFLST